MGNSSIKSSNKKLTQSIKSSQSSCCCCFNSSDSISSFSIDDKYYYPTFDRIRSNDKQHDISSSSKNHIYYCQSFEDLRNTINIDQWIDSLSILNTTTRVHQLDDKDDDIKQLEWIFTKTSNQEYLHLTKRFHLNFYLKDFQNRLKSSHLKQTFQNHYSSSKIIFPSNDTHQTTINDFNIIFTSPSESIIPHLLPNTINSYQIHEQIRSKCYFIPLIDYHIEPNDDEYKQKSVPLDRTHVVITLENNQTANLSKTTSLEIDSSFIFISNDSFQTGLIRINREKILKEFSSFIYNCNNDHSSYLSSNLIQQWFHTFILVNQTCAIVKRFLIGNTNHITCLFKESMNKIENLLPYQNNLIFASFRLPSCANSFQSNHFDDKSDPIIDAFSPKFLSHNKKLSNNTIEIDYEQYSFGLLLSRWPKSLIEIYYTHPTRYSKRQWPSKSQMDIIIKKSLLLLPNEHDHSWKINFDLIEEYLFELMNESTLYIYSLCQQFFSLTYEIRTLIKHSFLNYCENYGLPFSNNQTNLSEILTSFLKELYKQIHQKFLPNYFNHQLNMLNSTENYTQWFDYINQCLTNRIYLTNSYSISSSNRSLSIEFIFHFIDQLNRIFHHKRSEFYLNETILLDLHQQICTNLSRNHNSKELFENLFNNRTMTEMIQMTLTHEYDANAELVHNCLNQIRKAQTSLIFHYIWTIYIQYLHTYYNVIWNIERRKNNNI
ncbi:hypothetical protein I4U23_018474 [Adineta vaga]|nr:hypothetical protein I4U23_018474 [Adineta vaga]